MNAIVSAMFIVLVVFICIAGCTSSNTLDYNPSTPKQPTGIQEVSNPTSINGTWASYNDSLSGIQFLRDGLIFRNNDKGSFNLNYDGYIVGSGSWERINNTAYKMLLTDVSGDIHWDKLFGFDVAVGTDTKVNVEKIAFVSPDSKTLVFSDKEWGVYYKFSDVE